MTELLEGLTDKIISEARKYAEKNIIEKMVKFDPNDMMERLTKHTIPLAKSFNIGDFVTSTIMEGRENVDSDYENNNGDKTKPVTRYRFPLPGHPAKVIGVVPHYLQKIEDDSGLIDIEDLVIVVDTPDGMKEFVVSSRHFIAWTPDMKIHPAFTEWVYSQYNPEVM